MGCLRAIFAHLGTGKVCEFNLSWPRHGADARNSRARVLWLGLQLTNSVPNKPHDPSPRLKERYRGVRARRSNQHRVGRLLEYLFWSVGQCARTWWFPKSLPRKAIFVLLRLLLLFGCTCVVTSQPKGPGARNLGSPWPRSRRIHTHLS